MIGFLRKIFFKILNPDLIESRLNELKINKCYTSVICDPSSKFYEQASVKNFANKKDQIVIGKNTNIRGELVVFPSGGKITIGDNSFVGENSKIWSQSGISIGNNVLISHGVNIHDTNMHPVDYLERRKDYLQIISSGFPKENTNVDTKEITIEDDVWIGFNCIILKSVKIGKGAIIAAGTVLAKDVEAFTMVAGNPQKEIKKLN